MTDAELTARLYPKTVPACVRPEPDCAQLHLELRRPAVTLALLHVEYLAEQPQGLRYSAFCVRYREWLKRQSPVMRQVHLAGDKLFVDYSGMKPRLVDQLTGEVIEVELFVAVLGASNYTYAEATRTQQVSDFTSSVDQQAYDLNKEETWRPTHLLPKLHTFECQPPTCLPSYSVGEPTGSRTRVGSRVTPLRRRAWRAKRHVTRATVGMFDCGLWR